VTIRRHLTALARGLADAGLALASAVALALHILIFVPGFGTGLLFVLPWPIVWLRRLPAYARLRFGIATPYRPEPEPPQPDASGRYAHDRRLYRYAFWPKLFSRLDWLLGDRAFGRDLAWLFVNTALGLPLALAPLALAVAAVMLAGWWGVLAIPVAVAIAPWSVAAYAAMSKGLLGPPPPIGRVRIWWGIHFFAGSRPAEPRWIPRSSRSCSPATASAHSGWPG
jgi:hypothetical protein